MTKQENNSNKLFLWVFFGLIASGKSTLAATWAAKNGYDHFNSDVERKKIAGIAPDASIEEAAGAGIYSAEFTRRTYDRLLELAGQSLSAGRPVIVDASYSKREERDRVQALAKRLGVECVFLFCFCSREEVERRLIARRLDPEAVSDGRMEIYEIQKKGFEPPDELDADQLIRFDTEHPLEDLLVKFDEIVRKRVPRPFRNHGE